MIEAIEVKHGEEMPTETDLKLLFDKMRKPMEALQTVFVHALKELNDYGVSVKDAKLSIADGDLTIRLGDYLMWESVEKHITNLRG